MRPWRLGRRNEFLVKSQVPSPTVMVLDEYELDPAGERWSLSAGAMTAMGSQGQPKPAPNIAGAAMASKAK